MAISEQWSRISWLLDCGVEFNGKLTESLASRIDSIMDLEKEGNLSLLMEVKRTLNLPENQEK